MKQIWFKQKFYNLILGGKKTQTIRLWKRKPNLISGEDFECFFGFNHQKLFATVDKIVIKNFEEITENEVNQDGFVSKDELLTNLKNYYPDFDLKTNLYLIQFKLKNH